jgi:hypothetical protein
MSDLTPTGEQIADYTWLDKSQRSWHLWSGNPFWVQMLSIPLKSMTREEVVAMALETAAEERRRFAEAFPSIKWETFSKEN